VLVSQGEATVGASYALRRHRPRSDEILRGWASIDGFVSLAGEGLLGIRRALIVAFRDRASNQVPLMVTAFWADSQTGVANGRGMA
jgi:hypothetical protein